MQLFLVRHGATNYPEDRLAGRTPGVRLSANGFDQAKRAASWLFPRSPNQIFSSPLERTLETARSISTSTGAPVKDSDLLLEFDYGVWTGRSFSELQHDLAWQQFHSLRNFAKAPGGESLVGAQARILDLILPSLASGVSSVVFVTHAEMIRCAISLAVGISLQDAQHISVQQGSISTLDIAQQVRLTGLNVCP